MPNCRIGDQFADNLQGDILRSRKGEPKSLNRHAIVNRDSPSFACVQKRGDLSNGNLILNYSSDGDSRKRSTNDAAVGKNALVVFLGGRIRYGFCFQPMHGTVGPDDARTQFRLTLMPGLEFLLDRCPLFQGICICHAENLAYLGGNSATLVDGNLVLLEQDEHRLRLGNGNAFGRFKYGLGIPGKRCVPRLCSTQ